MIKVSDLAVPLQKLEQITRSAVTMLGLDAQVEKDHRLYRHHEVSDPRPPRAW